MHWDKRQEKPEKHGKFDSLWLGPYIIDEVAGTNSFYLNDLEGERLSLPVNGFLLKMILPRDSLMPLLALVVSGPISKPFSACIFKFYVSYCCIIYIHVL